MVYFNQLNTISIQVSKQRNILVALVKREIGANPIRTRHRNQGIEADISLGNWEDGCCDDL